MTPKQFNKITRMYLEPTIWPKKKSKYLPTAYTGYMLTHGRFNITRIIWQRCLRWALIKVIHTIHKDIHKTLAFEQIP